MIFYGDRWERKQTRQLLDGLARLCEELEAQEPGPERRAGLTQLLIEAGELWQGLADAGFHARGHDDVGGVERMCSEFTLEVARALERDVAGEHVGFEWIQLALEAFLEQPLPEEIDVNAAPEGYAYHAVYPEQYLEAAQALRGYEGPFVVIGLRSIGTSLAAMVAAAAGAQAPVTLRPTGHPFQREVRVSPELEELLLSGGESVRYAIVDEGPGLSGSSFGAVADWLEAHGVSADRLHFFPSHRNAPGPHASEAHRERWNKVARHVEDFDPSLLVEGVAPAPEDVAAGRWREHVYASEQDWPAADFFNERRKYLLKADGRTWLAKFAGLGRHGEAKLARAKRLEEAGLHPEVRGLRHGFLFTAWLPSARPFQRGEDDGREALLQTARDYVSLMARGMPARSDAPGAPPRKLLEMARYNAEQALGAEVAGTLERWRERVSTFSARAQPVATDNRMHPWEWLALSSGQVLKVDAVDHACGPDLIGEQDIAWDVAGASVELELSGAELESLLSVLPRGMRPDAETLRFYVECYLAFQLGAYAMAAHAIGGFDAREGERLRAAQDWYGARLRALLENARREYTPLRVPSAVGA